MSEYIIVAYATVTKKQFVVQMNVPRGGPVITAKRACLDAIPVAIHTIMSVPRGGPVITAKHASLDATPVAIHTIMSVPRGGPVITAKHACLDDATPVVIYTTKIDGVVCPPNIS